ncbi:MAG TPA: glycerol-3-phosphate acyltransferase [Anaerolineae bacterium]|nr:glycerol-3-phosphate acyltransferase [Anaerolineae bacterium]HQK13040.1 glycerol-3-phosphate acyltransferase [Anaerolineae bacterium]
MVWVKTLLSWTGAYLLGSIPSGIIWGWIAKHIDVRKHGSGRTGGTNVWRTAGFIPAVLTAVTDALKGAAAIWLAQALEVSAVAVAVAGVLAVVGHNYSLYLGFRGGAGTATTVGLATALWSPCLPILGLTGVAVGLLVGHASVASITIALLVPLIFLMRGDIVNAVVLGLPVMALTLWALRPNIRRLRDRAERFLPIFERKPPLICLSRHPARQK